MLPLNRRQFLRFSTGIGAAIALEQFRPAYSQTPATQRELYPDEVTLHIQETPFIVGDRQGTAVTVNGSVPAPLLRFKEGQTIKLHVVNHLKEDTSIHWHGIILPFEMDGVPWVSFAGIQPGETFTYQFPLNQNGTYWYHSHSNMQEQRGHYGAFIIDPQDPEPYPYDRDYVILLSDWTFEDPHSIMRNLKRMPTFYNYQRRTLAHLAEDWEWKGMRMDPVDIADVTAATYTYLLNGQAPARKWTGLFTPGEKVRLRFINGSAMTFFDVRIPGLKMMVVQADGQNIEPVTVDEFRIGTAETYDVIVEPQAEEAYTIFAETMDRSGYARGTLAIQAGLEASLPPRRDRPVRTMADMGHGDHSSHDNNRDHRNHAPATPSSQPNAYSHGESTTTADHSAHSMTGLEATIDHSTHGNAGEGTDHRHHDNHTKPPTVSTYQIQSYPHGPDDHGIGHAGIPPMVSSRLHEPGIGLENTGTRVLVYTDLRRHNPPATVNPPNRQLELHLTGNMERYMWSFDGKKYSEAKNLTFYQGERLRLILVNDTMMEHPIHLHGMWMEPDVGAGAANPRKHTIIVKPAERLPVDITVDAPGQWAFHCHLLYHMDMGMFRVVQVIDPPHEHHQHPGTGA